MIVRDANPSLDILAALKPGWDSYGACAIAPDAIRAARVMLSAPSVVPCSDGGVQLEWHRDGFDIEIRIPPSADRLLCFVNDPDQ